MLSQKQILRKSAIKPSCNPIRYYSYKEKKIDEKCDDETASVTQTELQCIDLSDSTHFDSSPAGSSSTNETVYDENYRTTADHIPLGLDSNFPPLSEHITQSTPRKSVQFSKVVRVCLIPCRTELNVLRNSILWSAEEINSFKLNAYLEITQFIEQNQCTLKAAMSVLYQSVEMQSTLLKQTEASS